MSIRDYLVQRTALKRVLKMVILVNQTRQQRPLPAIYSQRDGFSKMGSSVF